MQTHIYFSYSDDDLANAASMGLVRRAKKSLETVHLTSTLEDDPLVLISDGQTVKLPSVGITKALCDCGALGVCKHVLSAILWLQSEGLQNGQVHNKGLKARELHSGEQANAKPLNKHTQDSGRPTGYVSDKDQSDKSTKAKNLSDDNPQDEHTPAFNPKLTDPISDILSLDPATLIKSTPKAARQLAHTFVQSWLSDGGCVLITDGAKLGFDIAGLATQVYYFSGAGLAGMLSDLPAKQQPAVHLACLAYVFISHKDTQVQARWQWDAAVAAVVHVDALSTDDSTLIDTLMGLCLSFIRQGLSHIATSSVTALHLLNMQARTQQLPRLASELRSLHGAFVRYLVNDVAIDEQGLFVRLSRFYAYLVALKSADGERLKWLRGRVRGQYQTGEQLSLVPLGVHWWMSDSGARGLSLCLWDVGTGVMHTVTNARANALDTTFDQDSAAHNGIWHTPIYELLDYRLQLTQVKFSDAGKLSAGKDVQHIRGDALADMSLMTFRTLVDACDDWQMLTAQLRPTSLIDAISQRHVFVYVTAVGEVRLNELAQRFECALYDKQGAPLIIAIPVAGTGQQMLKKLEYWQQTGGIAGVLLHIRQVGAERLFLPCSLLIDLSKSPHSKTSKNGVMVFSLDYHHVPALKKKSLSELLSGRIERLLQQKKHHTSTPANALTQLLTQSEHILTFYASSGRQALDADDVAALTDIAERCRSLGLYRYGDVLTRLTTSTNLPEALLQARLVLYGVQGEMVGQMDF